MTVPDFDEFLGRITRLTPQDDPTIETAISRQIRAATADLSSLPTIDRASLTAWVADHPETAYVLGLVMGMSKERLQNSIRNVFLSTSSIAALARREPTRLIRTLDEEFDLVRLLQVQLGRAVTFGDVLIARAGGQARAKQAATLGRSLEDAIEDVVRDLGLPYRTRTRFVGKGGTTGPADLVIGSTTNAKIIVAAKAFDSTGSKQSAAVDEVRLMAEVRLPNQYLCVVIDGMGWVSRRADLRRMYDLWSADLIDGLYTTATLDDFRRDVAHRARLLGYPVA